MAGIYFHIPYCKQACVYCNFHFSTNLAHKDLLIQALHKELELRKTYLNHSLIHTIYFGGGTPSLLSVDEVRSLLDHIQESQTVEKAVEITFEVNPDDLNYEYLKHLKTTGINRLSIGIQSFFNNDMVYMHRAHSAAQSFAAIELSREVGFENVSIDLIYGIPGMTLESWNKNLEFAFNYTVPHLSCYALTVEPKTQLHHQIKEGKSNAPDELETLRQFEYLMQEAPKSGYHQYEISNFAKPGFESRHNSSYWQGVPYLGIGPSAHSYNGHERQWNISNNIRYINAISSNQPYFEVEQLDAVKQYNEFILTRIRTARGVYLSEIPKAFQPHFIHHVMAAVDQGFILHEGDCYYLTQAGKFIADRITMELFYG